MSEETKGPRFELVGPTIADDVQRLIARYGKAEVRKAALKLTKEKRGRRAEKDLHKLAADFEKDARDWLDGRDPIALRSHYSVAQAFAIDNPGHNPTATVQRVMKKLVRKREWIMLVRAYEISRAEYPYQAYLRAIEALANLEGAHPVWASILENSREQAERYLAVAPDDPTSPTMAEIEKPANALLSPALLALQPKGLFGAALRRKLEK